MRKVIWIAAATVVGTALSGVVNLLAGGGAWWLWPALGVLVVAAIVVAVVSERHSSPLPMSGQKIEARNGTVEDSPQMSERRGGPTAQEIKASGGGAVRRSGQTARER